MGADIDRETYLEGLRNERANEDRAGRTEQVKLVDQEIGRIQGRKTERATDKTRVEKR
ncbi:hypothetical protein Lxx24070 [Leifsonia xyli subsp. xyli str. CTCB07]|uniref:Uncharacterized protein n=1 Tax=Leifsonia xyli subsp. xyli (strain CTCB07) TaxID=281090 RepID=Q6AC50_LEIXX|nr:hypothetical protein [Leifsonia xyli]AAT90042.1 hypothetical protein Lxx24070 [Leifsonia xyli subsp. xyli str. CTCB07]